jgi:DNA-binding CsgD family transcriptional regulator
VDGTPEESARPCASGRAEPAPAAVAALLQAVVLAAAPRPHLPPEDGACPTARDLREWQLVGVVRRLPLPAYVEIALARHAVAAGRSAAGELSGLAADFDASLLHAVAAQALGAVLLAEAEPRAALAALQESCLRWDELSAPYERARARVGFALACRELGDGDSADIELEAARSTFARLGAAPDLERLDRLSGEATASTGAGLTARELEVLALVAQGNTNREIAAELVISPHTVRRHLQNIFRKLGVSSRAAATAFAVQHDLVEHGRMARTNH